MTAKILKIQKVDHLKPVQNEEERLMRFSCRHKNGDLFTGEALAKSENDLSSMLLINGFDLIEVTYDEIEENKKSIVNNFFKNLLGKSNA